MSLEGFIPRITLRPPSALETQVLGEMILLQPVDDNYPKPVDPRQQAAIRASLAEAMIERSLVSEAINLLDAAQALLPQTTRNEKDLSKAWASKQRKWERWLEKMVLGKEDFKKGESCKTQNPHEAALLYKGAARELAVVARETSLERLPTLTHQILHHRYSLEDAINGALAVFTDHADLKTWQNEMGLLHRRIHRDMFWSPVTYSGIPNVTAPESVLMRSEILLLKAKLAFEWTEEDDKNILRTCETIHIDDAGKPYRHNAFSSYDMLEFIKKIGFCRQLLETSPMTRANLHRAEQYFQQAQNTAATFGNPPPHFIATILTQMGLLLQRLKGGG